MIGQIQLVRVPDPGAAMERLYAARERLLAQSPKSSRRASAGAAAARATSRSASCARRAARRWSSSTFSSTLATRWARTPSTRSSKGSRRWSQEIAGGVVCLRILSNLADRRLARATVRVPVAALGRDGMAGEEVARADALRVRARVGRPVPRDDAQQGHHERHRRRRASRPATTGASIEAAAHAYAARDGRYRSLTTWAIEDRHLVGSIELPMAVSTVGPAAESHPRVRLAFRVLGVGSARELGGIMAAVGLASNMAAMRALATEGIQKGHMALHARAVSHAAGARTKRPKSCGSGSSTRGEVKIDRARELLRSLETRS